MESRGQHSERAGGSIRLRAVVALSFVCSLALLASQPSWWQQRGVLAPNSEANDYAPINQGQLKNLARAAVAEMDARLPGGAGSALHSLVDGWSTPSGQTNDYAPVNIGQLKNVAALFYQRLIAVNLAPGYPWANSALPANDFALANVGQAKALFAFTIGSVLPADQMQDWLAWLAAYGLSADTPFNDDADGDGAKNLDEFLRGSDPLRAEADSGLLAWIDFAEGGSAVESSSGATPNLIGLRVYTRLR